MKLITTLAVVTASFSTMTAAQSQRDLGSHEHGSAFLNIAVLDDSVTLELETPWNNLTGFEHKPRTDAQHALMDDALARLNQPDDLFAFVGSNCLATETVIENTLELSDHDEHEDHDEHDDHDEDEHHDEHDEDEHHDEHDEDKHHDEHDEDEHHDEHDEDEHHDEHHEDEHHDEHDEDEHHDEHDEDHDEHKEHDDHAGHDDDEETHSSLLVSYSFSCDDIKQLETIDVKLLEIWSGFEELDVQLIGPGGQDALELSPQQTIVDITKVL